MIKETKKETQPVDMVQIPKSQLDEMNRVLNEVKANNDILMQIADKKSLGMYYQRNQGKIPQTCFLRAMDINDPKTGKTIEKIIVGWKTTQDEVFQDPVTFRWTERQKLNVIYEDGVIQEFYLMDYVRRYKQVKVEIVKKITDETTGDIALEVKNPANQRVYTVGIQYVN
jgi:nitrate reductase alpha subunit